MVKDKKKTLTISSNLKKKIDTRSISTSGKKSFFVEKKKPYKAAKTNKLNNIIIINFKLVQFYKGKNPLKKAFILLI